MVESYYCSFLQHSKSSPAGGDEAGFERSSSVLISTKETDGGLLIGFCGYAMELGWCMIVTKLYRLDYGDDLCTLRIRAEKQ